MNPVTLEIDNYISNCPVVKKLVSDFTTIKFIEKESCGLGGTSTILDITDQTIIICSPLIGMIQGKEQVRKEHQLFIYGHNKNKTTKNQSNDTWATAENHLRNGTNFILNTTPNQLVQLKETKPFLYDRVKMIPVFVDESHMAAENSYRPELAEFMHLLFNEWQVPFSLSTATPCFKLLDIPDGIKNKMCHYKIKRTIEPLKPITVYPFELYKSKIMEEHAKGNKVVLFTNSKKVMENIVSLEGITTQFLVGDSLDTKIKPIKKFTAEELSNMDMGVLSPNIDVSILSTKYLTGYDITFSATIFIISNYNPTITVDNRTVNDIVQAYGRMRNKVISAAVFYNNKNYTERNNISYFENKFSKALKEPVPDHMTQSGVNHTLVLHQYLPSIEEFRTFADIELFKESMTVKGFHVDIQPIQLSTLIHSVISIPDKIKHLLSLDAQTLKYHTDKVFSSIQGDSDSYHGFGKQYLALFSSAYIIKLMENDWLLKSVLRSTQIERLITVMKTFIDINTNEYTENEYDKHVKYHAPKKARATALKRGGISSSFHSFNQLSVTFKNCVKVLNTLYTINLVKGGDLRLEDLQRIELNEMVSEQVRKDYVAFISKELNKDIPEVLNMIEQNHLSLNNALLSLKITPAFYKTARNVTRSLSFEPTHEQLQYILSKIEKHRTTLAKFDPFKDEVFDIKTRLSHICIDRKSQITRHKFFLLGMLSLDIAEHTCGFKKSSLDNREYNFATKCPSYLRKYTPYDTTEIDIVSANPQFIDSLLGTSVAFDVYTNLMTAKGIDRIAAKVLFNSTINNQRLTAGKAIGVYLASGYPEDKAKELASLTCNEKIFLKMTQCEKKAMDDYKLIANLKNPIRVHDGFIVQNYSQDVSALPLEAGRIRFIVKKSSL